LTKILVIGPGGLGAALGAALVQRGHGVGFVGRSGPARYAFALDHGGQAGLVGTGGPYDFPAPDAAFRAEVALVFVAVKAYDLGQALEAAALAPVTAPVVAVGNGSVEHIVRAHAERQPQRDFRLGAATIGVSVLGQASPLPSYGLRSTAGVVAFGPFLGPRPEATGCEAALTRGDPIFHWERAALYAHRRKWLYNTVINSLCAAHQLPRNGELLGRRPELDEVFAEAYAFGRARWSEWAESREALYDGLLRLIGHTSQNENSMARDLRLGRPTESDYLAGLAAGDPAYPRLARLHERIKALQERC
jgi:ketopantoate reductase